MGYDEIHATQTRASGYSRPVLLDRQVLTGYIHRAIADLDPMAFLWIQYRYRSPGIARTNHGENFRRDYFDQYNAEHLTRSKTGTRRIVRTMISIAMECGANPDQKIEPQGFDIDRRNWNKTYRPHFRQICDELKSIDERALFFIWTATASQGRDI